MRETDATGALFFSEQLNLGLEAFEVYFNSLGLSAHELLRKENFSLPIVHAEANFYHPLQVGDKISLHLSLARTGTTSFSLQTKVWKGDLLAGETTIVHVAISAGREPIPLPSVLLTAFEGLQAARE